MTTENDLVRAPSRVKSGSYQRVGLFDIDGDKTVWHGMRGKEGVSIVLYHSILGLFCVKTWAVDYAT